MQEAVRHVADAVERFHVVPSFGYSNCSWSRHWKGDLRLTGLQKPTRLKDWQNG